MNKASKQAAMPLESARTITVTLYEVGHSELVTEVHAAVSTSLMKTLHGTYITKVHVYSGNTPPGIARNEPPRLVELLSKPHEYKALTRS
jgi:hypothetical protein